MRILVDLDGVVADLHKKWAAVYNEERADADQQLDFRQLETYDVHEHVARDYGTRVYAILVRDGFFDNLDVIPGAYDGLQALKQLGHEVLICTAAACADSARAKITWCGRRLGINRKQVIITHRKALVDADVLIDDHPENLELWARSGRRAVAMGYRYNEHLRDRVAHWAADIMRPLWAWSSIVEWVRRQP